MEESSAMGICTEGEETIGKYGVKLPSQGAHIQGEPCVKVLEC